MKCIDNDGLNFEFLAKEREKKKPQINYINIGEKSKT